jgi:hypothetical protein
MKENILKLSKMKTKMSQAYMSVKFQMQITILTTQLKL